MKWTVNKKEIDFAVASEKTRVPFCMLDLSPSPPGGPLPLFHIPKRTPCHKQISGGSRGGTRGACPPPPYVWTKLRPQGPKHFSGRRPPLYLRVWITETPPYLKIWIQHCKYYYFLCLALRLTCKKLKNNCISLNLFHFKAEQIHCSVFGVRSEIKATKEWAVRFVKRFFHRYLRLLLCQGFFKL